MAFRFIWRIDFEDEAQMEPFKDNWRAASEILQQYPGARGTRIYEVLGNRAALLAVAEWESAEARASMTDDSQAGESELSKAWLGFPKNEEFGTVTVLASGDEIDYVPPADSIPPA